MRIGMVSIWFHRGQSEVTRTLRQAMIDDGHEVFVFARMGGVYGMDKQERDDPYWQLPNVYFYPNYQIPLKTLNMWAQVNKLDAVVFNEEYDFMLPAAMKDLGLKTIHYVDFLRPDWADDLRLYYDQLWSASKRTLGLLDDYGLADLSHYIGWGIPVSLPYNGDEAPQFDFFHNAGWFGINMRKGTDLVIEAFSRLREVHPQYSLLIHAQLPAEAIGLAELPGGIAWSTDTCPPPGAYQLGKIVVHPSRMEGLGLPIPEAMWQGRAVVTTDAPPMNEFVTNPALLAAVASRQMRADGLSFPECTADIDDLAMVMENALSAWQSYGQLNRLTALEMFSWPAFRKRIDQGLRLVEKV